MWLLAHVLLGVALSVWRPLSTFWGAGAFFLFLGQTLATRNRTGAAHLGAAYIVGMEVLLRMTKAGLFWEFGKLSCLVLLATGILVERRRRYDWHYLGIALLLLPAILLGTDVEFNRFRQNLTFQLGGMFLLSLSAVYFSKRPFVLRQLQDVFRMILLPVAAMVTYLVLVSPSVSEIEFNLASNFAASGGYGPNQVSTILGLGMLVLSVNFLMRWPPLFARSIDIAFLALLAFRALLTFSRGGVLGFLIAVFVGYLIYLLSSGEAYRRRMLVRFLAVSVLVGVAFYQINLWTGDLLLKRFGKGTAIENPEGRVDLDRASSGRSKIMVTDWAMFLDHPFLGVGVGESNKLRPMYGYANISHLEQTRLLAEHGIFGAFILLWLFGVLFGGLVRRRGAARFLLVVCWLFAFITMFHSATRLAVVGFMFGLGLIRLYETNTLDRQSPIARRGLSFRGRNARPASVS